MTKLCVLSISLAYIKYITKLLVTKLCVLWISIMYMKLTTKLSVLCISVKCVKFIENCVICISVADIKFITKKLCVLCYIVGIRFEPPYMVISPFFSSKPPAIDNTFLTILPQWNTRETQTHRAGKIRFSGAQKSVLVKASSGERCVPRNFGHLKTLQGTRIHLIVYLLMHQIKYG